MIFDWTAIKSSWNQTLDGEGHVAIYENVISPELPSVVIVPGYSETFLKYDEVIAFFLSERINVFALDHRGMGLSKRTTPRPQLVHIEKFDDHVADMQRFMKEHVRALVNGPVFLVAHSTGGLIALHYLRETGCENIAGLILSAPLLRLNIGIPQWLIELVVNTMCLLGFDRHYVFQRGDIDVDQFKVEDFKTTSDPRSAQKQIDLWKTIPRIIVGGPSNNWVKAIIAAIHQARGIAKYISVPVLLLTPLDDYFVGIEEQRGFHRDHTQCRAEEFSNTRHEIFMERPEIRSHVLASCLKFIRSNAPKR